MAAVESVSTKRINSSNDVNYNFRSSDDIGRYINYVLNGNQKEKPMYASSNGFISSDKDASQISDEVQKVQKLYRKESGLRIRGENVIIMKDELLSKDLNDVLITSIADDFSKYYFGQGFQNAYGIYEMDDCYIIKYAINATSFADGSKYKHNDTDIKEQEDLCINTVIANVLGRDIPEGQGFDFDCLEYSHFICN